MSLSNPNELVAYNLKQVVGDFFYFFLWENVASDLKRL